MMTNDRYKKQNAVVPHTRVHRCFGMFIFMFFLLFSACEKDEYDPRSEIPLRTVLCYMGGDNNLSYEVTEKIEQIKKAHIAPNCRLLIYQDTKDALPRLSEIMTSNNGTNTVKVIHEYEASNSADAEVFASVLREITTLYPSRSYGLVLFSHASGWLPEHTYNTPALRSDVPSLRSIVIDKRVEMELPAFASAIPDGMFDFIVFEACFMASVEVAYELKDKTKYIVASSAEIVSPGFTDIYAEALPLLFELQANLVGFVKKVEANCATRQGDMASLTISVINIKKLDALAAVLQGCEWNYNSEWNNWGERLAGSNAPVQGFDRKEDSLFFDFGDWFSVMVPKQTISSLQTALSQCVEYKAATPVFMPSYGGFEVVSHSGLTTYIPQEKYPNLNEAYKRLKWYKEVLTR